MTLGLTLLLGMEGPLRTAVVLEAAMPSMVLGLVLCDRFGLDTHLYAEIVVLTTGAGGAEPASPGSSAWDLIAS